MSASSAAPKVALVTGASSGMGKETAKRLLAAGYTVYVAARRRALMDDLAALGAIPLSMDITQDADIQQAVASIVAGHGAVDVLINNAGFGLFGSVEETSLEDARYQFEVNLFGLARLTQLLLPGMRAKGAGTIVNLSSMGGKIYTPLGAWYHATKHAIEGFSDCLRIELAPLGIKVVIIEPGIIATEFGEVMSGPMLARSGKGPYRALANATAKAVHDAYAKPGGASPASLVVDGIMQALAAKQPKTRYAMGKMAKPMMFIRKYFGDRLFDKALLSQVK